MVDSQQQQPTPPGWVLYLTSAVTGFGVMGAEMSAGRLMAPYYGTSTMIWSLLIGAVMISLALGHVLGGWLSRRADALKLFFGSLIVAAIILAALPWISRPLMQESLTWFRQGALGILAASAVGVLGLLTVPLVALGTSGPVLIHHAVHDREQTGVVAGRLYAAGTLGSLAGTYLAGVILVPLWGTTHTFWLCAALILANGVLGLVRGRMAPVAAVGALILAAALAAVTPARPVKPGEGVIYEAESVHNYIQVRERNGVRGLYLNDGYAVQTLYSTQGRLSLQGTWRYYARAPAWTATGSPSRVLLLGLGGGGAAVSYATLFPEAEVTGVELDAEVVEVGRRFMGLPESTRVVVQDARAFLARDESRYDVIIVDAFDFPYVPFQLATREFFEAVEAHLADGGVVVINVGRYQDDYRVVDAIAKTLKTLFARVEGVDVRQSNTVLMAARHPRAQDVGLDGLGLEQGDARRLRARPLKPWEPAEDALVLTDDRAPVEWMTDGIILSAILGQ